MAATYATQRMRTLNLGASSRQATDAIPGNSSPIRVSPRISTRSMTGVLCGASPNDSPSSSPAKSEFGDLDLTRKAIVVEVEMHNVKHMLTMLVEKAGMTPPISS